MKKTVALIVVIIALFSLNGCGRKGEEVLARINNEVITLEEFNEKIERMPIQYQEMVKGKKKEFLNELVKEELLYEEAVKAGIENDPETQEVISAAHRKILISGLLKKRVEDNLSVSEEDIKKYYDEHSEEFMLPERWRASHILVDTEEEAKEAKKQLDQGADFSELAEERSKDATSRRAGDVGYFSKGQLIPEFESTCFELEIGEISDIVKTQFGYHIIKLTEKKSPEVQEFLKVKDVIKKEMEREQKIKLLEELMADLQDKAKVTINEGLIADPQADDIEAVEIDALEEEQE